METDKKRFVHYMVLSYRLKCATFIRVLQEAWARQISQRMKTKQMKFRLLGEGKSDLNRVL